ncbi:hypothetical protein D3C78_1074400 [compost metagenome]
MIEGVPRPLQRFLRARKEGEAAAAFHLLAACCFSFGSCLCLLQRKRGLPLLLLRQLQLSCESLLHAKHIRFPLPDTSNIIPISNGHMELAQLPQRPFRRNAPYQPGNRLIMLTKLRLQLCMILL